MAELDPTSRRLAKRLATLAAASGEQALGEIGPALEKLIGQKTLSDRKAFIRAFLAYFRRELRSNQLHVEYAGSLTDAMVEAIRTAFTEKEKRSLQVITEEQPNLISGFRVRLGDNIYDASIAGRLDRLAASGT